MNFNRNKPMGRSPEKQQEQKVMKNQFDELAESHSQSGTRRGPLWKFGVSLAGVALAGLLTLPAVANDLRLGPVVELSRPNAVAGCDDGLVLPGPYTLDDAAEPFVAVNPINPREHRGRLDSAALTRISSRRPPSTAAEPGNECPFP